MSFIFQNKCGPALAACGKSTSCSRFLKQSQRFTLLDSLLSVFSFLLIYNLLHAYSNMELNPYLIDFLCLKETCVCWWFTKGLQCLRVLKSQKSKNFKISTKYLDFLGFPEPPSQSSVDGHLLKLHLLTMSPASLYFLYHFLFCCTPSPYSCNL